MGDAQTDPPERFFRQGATLHLILVMATNLEKRLFWQKEAQKLANAFWFWTICSALAFFGLKIAVLGVILGVLAAACVVQSFRATAHAEGYRE
jgi:hypothetical protein